MDTNLARLQSLASPEQDSFACCLMGGLRKTPKEIACKYFYDEAGSRLFDAICDLPEYYPTRQESALLTRIAPEIAARIPPGAILIELGSGASLKTRLLLDAAPQIAAYMPIDISVAAVRDGAAWYAYNVRIQTTTNRTPAQIHETGLAEVKRIHGQMDSVMKSIGYKGTFAEFTNFLRTDPKFFFTDSADLVRAYRDIVKRIDPELINLFGHLPRLPYGVNTIPAYAAKSATTAYYQPGSYEAGRPGYYYVNTYALNTRPKWEMEALSSHEAVPGHHLQIAISQELTDLPNFRRYGGYTAFVEGWALYSESLGPSIGLYKDPYSKFGQLTYEMWRAIRLVIDTGIHAQGMSRQDAIDYFAANSAKTQNDIVVEVDRYITTPGQALAYKTGELKIKELRAYAEQQLGDKFDIREFHDQVLGQGALPLDMLDARIRAWVSEKKTKA